MLLTCLLGLQACADKQNGLMFLDSPVTHRTGDGFQNPYLGPINKSAFGFLRMKYFGDQPFADHEEEAHRVPVASFHGFDNVSVKATPHVTWIGHSTFLLQYAGVNVLFDPVFSARVSPVSFAGPKRLVDLPIKLEDLPEIDFVVISHNHYDHLDTDSLAALGDGPRYMVPLRNGALLREAGISDSRIHEFDWWQSLEFDGFKVTATPSQHWSARGLFDRNQCLWAAWRVEIENFSIWFAGDTGYNPYQFKETAQRLGPVDLALIPIGAYAPEWFMQAQHVTPEQALELHIDVQAKQSFGMHWGTFQLSAEPMMEPKLRLQKALDAAQLEHKEFSVLAIGETRSITLP